MTTPTVLFVDDERINLLNFQVALRESFTVFVAPSGEAALDLLQRERVDLVMTDHRMPGMSGATLARRVRERGLLVPVLIVTGYVDNPDVAEAVESGAVAEVIDKPYVLSNLVQRIEHWTSRSS